MAEGARREGLGALILPEQNDPEASSIDGPTVYGVRSLEAAFDSIAGREDIAPAMAGEEGQGAAEEPIEDFADVAGHGYAKRALEVTAAGGHNILMRGPPGSGKTMLARRMPGILPPLIHQESIEVSKVHSAAGEGDGTLVKQRPFRAPHDLPERTRGRWEQPPPRGGLSGPPRGLVPRRVSRIQPRDAGGIAPAHGRRAGDDLAGSSEVKLPGPLHAPVLDERVSVRLPGRPAPGVQVLGGPDRALPEPYLGAAFGSDRPLRGRATLDL